MDRGSPQNLAAWWRGARYCGVGLLLAVLAGCSGGPGAKPEFEYVNALQAMLRDHVSAVFARTGSVTNGERVEVLERSHNGRWLRVRGPRGEEGWIEARYLTTAAVFAAFEQLARQSAGLAPQAPASARVSLNMHLEPERQSDHLYQLSQGERLEILKRATSPRNNLPQAQPAEGEEAGGPALPELEDWWLVRDDHQRVGWVLARMVDIDVPLDVAQYAEGQRIAGAFVLDTVKDGSRQVPQYLLLLNEPQDGAPQDFNQLRVFTWDRRRRHYQTAYHERRLSGLLPAHTGVEDFGKEGKLPVFSVLLRDPNGQVEERKYKMNGVIVRRVLAPGAPATPAPQRDKVNRGAKR